MARYFPQGDSVPLFQADCSLYDWTTYFPDPLRYIHFDKLANPLEMQMQLQIYDHSHSKDSDQEEGP